MARMGVAVLGVIALGAMIVPGVACWAAPSGSKPTAVRSTMECRAELVQRDPLTVHFSLVQPAGASRSTWVPRVLLPVGAFVAAELRDASGAVVWKTERPKFHPKLDPSSAAAYVELDPGAAPSSSPASQPADDQAGAGPASEPGSRAAPQLDSTQSAIPATTPAPPVGPAWVKGKHVTPTFTVTEVVGARSNTASSKTHTDTPTYTGNVALDGSNWRYQIASVTGTGKITLVYYTADHYPAPTPTDRRS